MNLSLDNFGDDNIELSFWSIFKETLIPRSKGSRAADGSIRIYLNKIPTLLLNTLLTNIHLVFDGVFGL